MRSEDKTNARYKIAWRPMPLRLDREPMQSRYVCVGQTPDQLLSISESSTKIPCFFLAALYNELLMKSKPSPFARLLIFVISVLAFANWESLANTVELDWTSS